MIERGIRKRWSRDCRREAGAQCRTNIRRTSAVEKYANIPPRDACPRHYQRKNNCGACWEIQNKRFMFESRGGGGREGKWGGMEVRGSGKEKKKDRE